MTGLLTTLGLEFQDWSAEYRLFSRQRLPVADIFAVIRRAVLAELPPAAPLSVAIDDSLLHKTGIRIPGVAWRRDPLGPPFQTNFVRAQRFLQFSASVPLPNHAYRMVPISFQHPPLPSSRPRKPQPTRWPSIAKPPAKPVSRKWPPSRSYRFASSWMPKPRECSASFVFLWMAATPIEPSSSNSPIAPR